MYSCNFGMTADAGEPGAIPVLVTVRASQAMMWTRHGCSVTGRGIGRATGHSQSASPGLSPAANGPPSFFSAWVRTPRMTIPTDFHSWAALA